MSVNEGNTDRQQLRNYLLGRLPEDLAVQFDARLFADDALCQELTNEQDSLIEDFVYQRLTEEEQRIVQEQCASSLPLREKVASLRILLSALERQLDPSPTPSFLNLKQILTVLAPALTLMLCFAAFLYVREQHRNAASVSKGAQLVATSKEVAQPNAQVAPVAVAFLSANVLRGPAAVPKIKIPPAGTGLELQVEIRSSPSTPDYWDITLLRGNEVVQSSTHVPLHRLGQENYLSITIDPALLHAGFYRVRYSPQAYPGVPQYRSFKSMN